MSFLSRCWQAFKLYRKARRDPRTSTVAKYLPWLVVLYIFSPVNLIPDFIPILGQMDDVAVLGLLMWLALKLIPEHVKQGRPGQIIDVEARHD